MKRWPTNLLVLVVRGYQLFIRPMLGPHCRFHPTCSQYAIEALRTHGAFAFDNGQMVYDFGLLAGDVRICSVGSNDQPHEQSIRSP